MQIIKQYMTDVFKQQGYIFNNEIFVVYTFFFFGRHKKFLDSECMYCANIINAQLSMTKYTPCLNKCCTR